MLRNLVSRTSITAFIHFGLYLADQPVYDHSDTAFEQAMKGYTSANNPALASEDALFERGNLFDQFRENYAYEIRLFSEEVHILDLDGLTHVMVNVFVNAYNRFQYGESEVAYTAVE